MNWLHTSWLSTSNSECHLVLRLRKYAGVVEDRLSVRAHTRAATGNTWGRGRPARLWSFYGRGCRVLRPPCGPIR